LLKQENGSLQQGYRGYNENPDRAFQAMTGNLFNFCDLLCKYAETPKEEGIDGSGSCHTFIALYCTKKKSLVHKNMLCKDKVLKNRKEKKK
jgi:hypothetical protein